MKYLAGTIWEAPQQTHFYNNVKFERSEVEHLDPNMMVHALRDVNAGPMWRYGVPIFHMPRFGGWREYVVLTPVKKESVPWCVGWLPPFRYGASRIRLLGPVRVLRGYADADFFGVNDGGYQISIKQIGSGRIGEGGEFSQIPLL